MLEGDILEYENIGGTEDAGIEGIDVELLGLFLIFVNTVWRERYAMHLRGGKSTEPRKRKRSPLEMIRDRFKRVRDAGVSMIREKYQRVRDASQRVRDASISVIRDQYQRVAKSVSGVENAYSRARTTAINRVRSGLDYIQLGNQFFRMLGVTPAGELAAVVGASVITLTHTLNLLQAVPARVFPTIESFRIGNFIEYNADEKSIVPYDPNVGGQIVSYSGGTLPPNTFIGPIDDRIMNGGDMLRWKNKLTKRLRTHCQYVCSPLLWTNREDFTPVAGLTYKYFTHQMEKGTGPHLYMTYIRDTQANKRNPLFNTPKKWDVGMEPFIKGAVPNTEVNLGLGWNTPVYVFAADWPFEVMNHDPATQDSTTAKYGAYLSWKYVDYANTTETNPPIKLTNFILNKDWNYLTHYKTVLTFDMYNTSVNAYFVEILFFKFKADPDAMTYARQVKAVQRRQPDKVEDWIYDINSAPEDIKIVHRKRIMLGGDNSYGKLAGSDSAVNNSFNNAAQYKFTVRRTYVMKRPILSDYQNLSEEAFFNVYYEASKGIYCRMQAFTLDNIRWTTAGTFINDWTANEDVLNCPDTSQDGTNKNGKGVMVKMDKVSYFKLDENIYKS